MTRVLILGGTSEAAALAALVSRERPGLQLVTSLAGLLESTPDLPGSVRRGGFGGAAGLSDYLRRQGIGAVVDATHPFASTMARNACDAALEAGVPRIKLLRAMWARTPRDRWMEVSDAAASAAALAGLAPEAALVTLGSRSIAAFRGLAGVRIVFRMIAPPEGPVGIPGAEILLERGPFSLDHERALMTEHGIGALVTKASGGRATGAKIEVARERGLPVVMIRRPRPPAGATAATAEAVVDWLDRQEPTRQEGGRHGADSVQNR